MIINIGLWKLLRFKGTKLSNLLPLEFQQKVDRMVESIKSIADFL